MPSTTVTVSIGSVDPEPTFIADLDESFSSVTGLRVNGVSVGDVEEITLKSNEENTIQFSLESADHAPKLGFIGILNDYTYDIYAPGVVEPQMVETSNDTPCLYKFVTCATSIAKLKLTLLPDNDYLQQHYEQGGAGHFAYIYEVGDDGNPGAEFDGKVQFGGKIEVRQNGEL